MAIFPLSPTPAEFPNYLAAPAPPTGTVALSPTTDPVPERLRSRSLLPAPCGPVLIFVAMKAFSVLKGTVPFSLTRKLGQSPSRSLLPAPCSLLPAPQPEPLRLPSAGRLLVLLVLLCMLPRAVMALRIPSVCPDGVLYIHLAQAIEAGDFRHGFQEMSLNLYPWCWWSCTAWGSTGSWRPALWGVGISSLVVLPLWGWARRQFDDRVALVACLLYIVHPKMIEWSPEVMRDPTFWFLFMLAIYWLWRAVTEVRHGYFIGRRGGDRVGLADADRGPVSADSVGALDILAVAGAANGTTENCSPARRCAWCVFPLLLVLVNMVWLYGRLGCDAGPSRARWPASDPGCNAVLGHAAAASRRQPGAAADRRADDVGLHSYDDAGPLAGVRAVDVRRHLEVAAGVDPPRPPAAVLRGRGDHVRHLGAIVVRQANLPPLCLADRADGIGVCRLGDVGIDR